MLATKRSAGVTLRGDSQKSIKYTGKLTGKGINTNFETQGRNHRKSKTGPNSKQAQTVAQQEELISFQNLN